VIQFLAPAGIAAAAALVVPVVVHLVRRSDRRELRFAAMRYLRARPHPRARLRLVRPLLLALRVGLLVGLAALLALPVWRSRAAAAPPWVVVAPGIDALAARAAVHAPLAEWHRLVTGFPVLPDGRDAAALAIDAQLAAAPVPIHSLLRQLDRDLLPTVALSIVVPENLANLDAERLQIAHAATWLPLPGFSPVPPSPGAGADAPLAIAVRYDAAGASELPVVRALGAAWAADGRSITWSIAAADVPLPATATWVFWLGDAAPQTLQTLQARARTGGLVVVAPTVGEAVLSGPDRPILRAQTMGLGRLFEFTAPLRADALPDVLAADFPRRLWTALTAPRRIPASAPARSVAPLATTREAWAPAESLEPPLALVLALLFLLERLVATGTGAGPRLRAGKGA
jgi:hypothetical protein